MLLTKSPALGAHSVQSTDRVRVREVLIVIIMMFGFQCKGVRGSIRNTLQRLDR